MVNIVFIETFTSDTDYSELHKLVLPVQSFITYTVYKYCVPKEVKLQLIHTPEPNKGDNVCIKSKDSFEFSDGSKIPCQVSSFHGIFKQEDHSIYPVVLFEDVVITGLCAVARHIAKHRTSSQSPKEHKKGLLGYLNNCLQAPNQASIWTKFCEVDAIKTVTKILDTLNQSATNDKEGQIECLKEITKNLSRFENHLSKPVRVHNVYKVAREMKKNNMGADSKEKSESNQNNLEKKESNRIAKPRKWKSNAKKENEIQSSLKIEDLGISHQFAEGPYLTLADLVLLPSYRLILHALGDTTTQSQLPLTFQWYNNLLKQPEMQTVNDLMHQVDNKISVIENIPIPTIEDVSLYKRDPSRHNPKKRLFTKEEDIENALNCVNVDDIKLEVITNNFNSNIDWDSIPDGANPNAGHLPATRMTRKCQQLENLALAVLSIAKEGDVIIDFCSGSGHLGILIAHLLPKCTIILLENKEQSLLNARKRVHDMNMKNVIFFQCNVDFFIGKFDIGVALHACGIATDLVIDKCLKANAKFVLCPCCYGSLHSTDRITYPRGNSKFSGLNINQYMCISHAADQTHKDHPLTQRGSLCMAIIDSDRAQFAEEFGYKVTLSRLKPLTCTPKNNLLIGIPA